MFEQYKKTSVLLVFHVFRSTEIRRKRSPPVILAWTPSVTTLRLRAGNRTWDNLNKTKKGGRNDGKKIFLDSANTCNYFLQSQGHYIGRFSPGNWCNDLSNLFSNDRKPTQRDCNRSQTDWQRIANVCCLIYKCRQNANNLRPFVPIRATNLWCISLRTPQ